MKTAVITEPITYKMREQIELLRRIYQHEVALYAFNSMYIWKEDLALTIYLADDFFAVRYGFAGKSAWYFPCGNKDSIRLFLSERLQEGNLKLYGVRTEDVAFLEQEFAGQFMTENRESDYEYLYDRFALEELKGRKYSKLRNHINRLMKDHTVKQEAIREDNITFVQHITNSWTARSESQEGISDHYASSTLISEWRELGITGVVISIDDEPYAVVAGYPLSDSIMDMSFAKQKEMIPGLGFYAKHAFICSLPEQYNTINAEDDMGLPGLRMMKQQMLPMGMIQLSCAHGRIQNNEE